MFQIMTGYGGDTDTLFKPFHAQISTTFYLNDRIIHDKIWAYVGRCTLNGTWLE